MSSAPTSTTSASMCPVSTPTWATVPETGAPEEACCCSEKVNAEAFSVAIAASASAAAAWNDRRPDDGDRGRRRVRDAAAGVVLDRHGVRADGRVGVAVDEVARAEARDAAADVG